MLKRLFLYIAGTFFLLLLLLLLLASKNARGFPRDSRVLMNKYYALKASNPLAAEDALRLILKQNPTDLPALIEWSQWLLQQNQTQRAQPLLERIHQALPTNHKYSYQLGYAYYKNGQWEQATDLFLTEAAAPEGVWKERAERALHAMGSFLPFYQDWAAFSSCCSAQKPSSNTTLFKAPTDAFKKQSTVTQPQAINVMPERDATQKELVIRLANEFSVNI